MKNSIPPISSFRFLYSRFFLLFFTILHKIGRPSVTLTSQPIKQKYNQKKR